MAIVIGDEREDLGQVYEHVTLATIHECGSCMPWRNRMPIWIVRGPKVRLADRWHAWRHFE